MQRDDRVFVAGHRGLVGSALVRRLAALGFRNVLTIDRSALDLRRSDDVDHYFAETRPDVVFLAAASVGGIGANLATPADFIRDNLAIQTNVIAASQQNSVRRLVFFGSACVYPKDAAQPMREDALLTGPLEPSNEAYAIAKIAGVLALRAYRRQYGLRSVCLMPANLYGPGDRFEVERAHVVPALIARFVAAKAAGDASVTLWGTGRVQRELLFVDDLARAAVDVAMTYEGDEMLNVGSGEEIAIADLATLIADVVGYQGALQWDTTRTDGATRRLLDCTRIHALGWRAMVPLREGIERTYAWYVERLR